MKLLLVSSEFPPGPGGIGTHAYQLAKNFSELGQGVQVLCSQDYATESEILDFNNSQHFTIYRMTNGKSKLSKGVTRFKLMNDSLRRFKPDIVLSSGSWPIWLGALGKLHNRKVAWLVVGHGTEFGQTRGFTALFTCFTANKADGIICVSEFTKRAVRDLGIDKPPIEVIHNGADPQQYFMLNSDQVLQIRADLGVEGKFVLLTVGNVSARKGQEVVIRALPAILREAPHVVYWMAGLPNQQLELERLSKELGVEGHIRFFGRTNPQTLLELYNACDLFVMTSRQLENGDFEGYGIAVIEAALCGKAAVVSDNSGLSEAVNNDKTGLLVGQNDPQTTAEAIINLVNDPERLEKFSKEAQKKAYESQTWDKVAASYLYIIRKHVKSSRV